MVEVLERGERNCPFGELARHCPYQETYAQDVFAAIEGKMVFICTLDESVVCPYVQSSIDE